MFISQAHSFRQQARLAVTLAWIAGYTNIVTVLTCGTVTSHASGTTSTLGRELFSGNWRLAGFAFFLLSTFYVGSIISGFCTETGRRKGWESIYVLPIVIEAFLLATFALCLELRGPNQPDPSALYWISGLASMAMGLQNATITRISSGTVRTTHVTGVLTDLGQETVQFLWWLSDRRMNVPPGSPEALIHSVYAHPTARRLALLFSIFSTFALGAGLGTIVYLHFARFTMFPPVAFLGWIIYQDITIPIAEIEPSSLFNRKTGFDLPTALAVYHLHKDHDRKGKVHRLPNLLAWSERLPPTAQVIILDLMEAVQWNSNAVLELQALLARFESQGRELIIAGLSIEQFQHINGGQILLPEENACSDLELAIARGINLIELTGDATGPASKKL